MARMKFEVKRIHPNEARSLRHRVLWPHLATLEECVIDIDLREDAFHLGTFDGDRLVAIGSFFQMSSPKVESAFPYRLRAMASDPDYRGKGCGRLLVEKGLIILKEKGADVLWCDARLGAVAFYQSMHFEALQEVYEIPRIGPHLFMWKLV